MEKFLNKKTGMMVALGLGLLFMLLGFIDMVGFQDPFGFNYFLPDWLGIIFFIGGVLAIAAGIFLYWTEYKKNK